MTKSRKFSVLGAFVAVIAVLALLVAVNLNAPNESANADESAQVTPTDSPLDAEPANVAEVRIRIDEPIKAVTSTVTEDKKAAAESPEIAPCTDLITSATKPIEATVTLIDSAGKKTKITAYLTVRTDVGPIVAAKRPYVLTLEKPAKLLGMPKSTEWSLLGGFSDRSLLRTITAMELADRIGVDWAPRLTPATVEINGTPCGLYAFGESLTGEKDRLDLAAGDTRLVADSGDRADLAFRTTRDLKVYAPGLSKTEIVDAEARFQKVEDVLYSPRFPNNNYRDSIDVDSFIDWYLVNELTKNLGSPFKESVEMTLKADGTLAMGAPWNFDASQGNRRYGSWGLDNPKGWWLKRYWYDISDDPGWRQAFSPTQMWDQRKGHYYNVLMSDPAFANEVARRWAEVSGSVGEIDDFINETAEPLGSAARDNFSPREVDGAALPLTASFLEQDPNIFVFANTDENIAPKTGWLNEVALMRDWLSERIAWFNRQFAEQLAKAKVQAEADKD